MSIEVRKTKRGTVYRSRFMVSYERFASPWFPTKREAMDWMAEKRSAVNAGQVQSGAEMTLESFATLWLEKHAFVNKVGSAAIKDKQHLSRYIIPKLGRTKLRNLTHSQVEFLLSDIKAEGRLKPKTINNILCTVKKMLGDGVRWGYLRMNPASSIKPLKVTVQAVTHLYREEVQKLLGFSQDAYPAEYELFLFALNTGCRLGECLGLLWSKVDFQTQTAMIDAIYDSATSKIVMRTKGKRFRKVPLNGVCLQLLRTMALEGRQRESQQVFGRIGYDYFVHEKCRKIMREAGLEEALARGATFHATRHTFASEFMATGGDIYVLQHLLGHSTVQQTEKYSHFAPDYLRGATERVNFGASVTKPLTSFGK